MKTVNIPLNEYEHLQEDLSKAKAELDNIKNLIKKYSKISIEEMQQWRDHELESAAVEHLRKKGYRGF